MSGNRVDFLIVGAQRAGTTALARFLESHERICMAPCKEVHFFDAPEDPPGGWGSAEAAARYATFFPEHDDEAVVGEATPIYMYLPGIAARIKAYNPSMKLLFLLREPGERAVSQYWHERELRREYLPLSLALALERARLWWDRNDLSDRSSLRRHSYADRGHYARQIRRMLEEFPREQMLFLESEDLLADHSATLERVYDFLDIGQPATPPAPGLHNRAPGSGCRRCRASRRVARACSVSTRELEALLGWDLSTWRNA